VNFDDDFAPPSAPRNWNYDAPEVLRRMVSLYTKGDETRAQQLLGEVDAEVAAMRAKLGGRKVTSADFAGTKWVKDSASAEQWALRYTLKLQTV
jgi:hypothetical protein